jgi:hypothetical protein
MRVRPRHRVALRFKESVDHDGIALAGSSSASASGFATDYGRSGVDRGAGAIREDNFTAAGETTLASSHQTTVIATARFTYYY